MPTLARPDVDVLDGLTTAIIVDQERMGANVRSTVGTATDANAMLRILFSRLGQPHIGSPDGVLVQRPLGEGERRDHGREGSRQAEDRERKSSLARAACVPRCEGMGTVSDIDLTQLYDDTKSLNEGAITIPGYKADGWMVRIVHRVRLPRPGQADPQVHQEGAPRLPLQGADQGQGQRHQPHLRGADPQGRRSRSSPRTSDVAAAAHPGVRGAGGHVHRLSRLRRHPAQRGGPLVEDQRDQHRRRLRDADQRPGRVGPRPRRAVGGTAARRRCGRPSTRSWRSGWATSRSTGRRARCRAARRSAPR